jgi:plasmid stabilization system protein ParE
MPYRPPPLGPKHLVVTGSARADIDDALAYIAREAGIDTALRFAEQIDLKLHRLADVGHSGASREWLSPGLRLSLLGNYSIYFRVTPTETIIVRFLRGGRDITKIDFNSEDDQNNETHDHD